MDSSTRVGRGYDRLARSYDLMARAVYGNALRKAQTCFLAELPKNSDVLVIGGGSGWMLEALLRTAAPRHVRYVELSAKMRDLASQRIQDRLPELHATVDFVQGRAEDEIWQGQYDLVVTHCLLDMFQQPALEALVGQLQGVLKPHGKWYFSDFQMVAAWPMRWMSRFLIWMMYRFFRLTCGIAASKLPDFEHAFQMHGLTVAATRRFWGGMIVARMYDRRAQA